MFITRLFLVAVLAYLFNLLMVRGAPHHPSSSSSAFQGRIPRRYSLYHVCSGGSVEVRNKKVIANVVKTKYAHLEAIAASDPDDGGGGSHLGEIMIYGPNADRYLCFNQKGRLIARHVYKPEFCKFVEVIRKNNFNELRLASRPEWRIGFNRKGHALSSAKYGSKARCFSFLKRAPTSAPGHDNNAAAAAAATDDGPYRFGTSSHLLQQPVSNSNKPHHRRRHRHHHRVTPHSRTKS